MADDDMNAAIRSAQNPVPEAPITSVTPKRDPMEIPGYGNVAEKFSEAEARSKKYSQEAIDEHQRNYNELAEQRRHPIPIPGEDPHLRDVPKPPHEEFRDSLQVFSSPAIILATLGSLMTRQPATAALNAGAAAMEAFHKGDQEQIKLHMDQWKQATDWMIAQNGIEIQRYNASWKKYGAQVDARKAQQMVDAAMVNDKAAMAAIAQADEKPFATLMEARIKGQEELERWKTMLEAKTEAKNVPTINQPDAHLAAEAAMKGSYDLFNKFGRSPGNSQLIMDEMVKMGATGEQLAQAKAAQAGATSAARVLGTQEARFGVAEKAMEESIPIALQASENVPRGNWLGLNKLIQAGQTQIGNPALRRLLIATDTAAKDYARTINPHGVLRESDIEYARSVISKADSSETYAAALDQLRIEAGVMHRAIQRQKQEQSGGGASGAGTHDLGGGWSVTVH
jgi:hypothetical protein